MLRTPVLLLLLVAAAALVAADGKTEHHVKRATETVRDAVKSLHKRYSACAESPMGCKRDTEKKLSARAVNKDLFEPMKRALHARALSEKIQARSLQLRDAKNAADLQKVIKRAHESVARAQSVKKVRDATQHLKDSKKRFAEVPWKRAADFFAPMKHLQKKATLEKVETAKKHLRDIKDGAKLNSVLKRATETLKQNEKKRAMDIFAPLKRALEMTVKRDDKDKRELAKKTSEVKDVLKRAQESLKKTRDLGDAKRWVDSLFAPVKRDFQKDARSKMGKFSRAVRENKMKDSVKRAVDKLRTVRSEKIMKRMTDFLSPLSTMKRELHKRASASQVRDAYENLKRAFRSVAK